VSWAGQVLADVAQRRLLRRRRTEELLRRLERMEIEQSNVLNKALADLHADLTARFAEVTGQLERTLNRLPSDPPPESTPESDSEDPEHSKEQYWCSRATKQPIAYFLVAASAALFAIAAWSRHVQYPLEPGLILLAALAISSFLLRGSWLHDNLPVKACAFILFGCQFAAAVAAAVLGIQKAHELRPIVLLISLGMLGLVLVISIAMPWKKNWRFAEPLSVSLVAVWLGVLCLSGLPTFTGSLHYPTVDGAALLFATGAGDQKILLTVAVQPSAEQASREFFTIDNRGLRRMTWAFAFIGDAQINNIFTVLLHVESLKRSVFDATFNSSVSWRIQLFSGSIDPASQISINGTASGKFLTSTTDRTAVAFPEYGQGNLLEIGQEAGSRITRALS